jgi:hypothetical protein
MVPSDLMTHPNPKGVGFWNAREACVGDMKALMKAKAKPKMRTGVKI